MNRIAIIGCGGSGKSMLAPQLAATLDLPLTHLDAIYYDQDWNPLPQEEFAARQEKLVAEPAWIIEGNYASTRLVAHAALETYSVLTRLPPPHRALPGIVSQFLARRFPEPPLTLPTERWHELVTRLAGLQITGGRVYDALIAITAAEHSTTLVTLDRRASAVYEAVGVRIRLA